MKKKTTAQEVREEEARIEADNLTHRLESMAAALSHAERDPAKAATALTVQELADYTALVQDLRYRLGMVERDLATALGKAAGRAVGELADGRQWKAERSPDRKEWDHDGWKHDARRVIVSHTTDELGATVQMLTKDGEVQDLNLAALIHSAVTEAQEVHGSTAPRSRALKMLGLFATDYCISTPGPWRFSAVKPTVKEESTDD